MHLNLTGMPVAGQSRTPGFAQRKEHPPSAEIHRFPGKKQGERHSDLLERVVEFAVDEVGSRLAGNALVYVIGKEIGKALRDVAPEAMAEYRIEQRAINEARQRGEAPSGKGLWGLFQECRWELDVAQQTLDADRRKKVASLRHVKA